MAGCSVILGKSAKELSFGCPIFFYVHSKYKHISPINFPNLDVSCLIFSGTFIQPRWLGKGGERRWGNILEARIFFSWDEKVGIGVLLLSSWTSPESRFDLVLNRLIRLFKRLAHISWGFPIWNLKIRLTF